MPRLVTFALAALTFLVPISAQAQVATKPAESESEPQVAVVVVKHADADALAKTLSNVFKDQDVKIVATNGVLLVSGTEARIIEVAGLLKKLDAPPKLVRLRMTLVQLKGTANEARSRTEALRKSSDPQAEIRRWAAQDLTGKITHAELTVLEHQQAQIQVGEQKPVVAGASPSRGRGFAAAAGRGNTSPNYRVDQVGTLMTASARVTGDGEIAADLTVERSQFREGGAEIGKADDGTPLTIPEKDTLTLQVSERIPNGKEAVVGAIEAVKSDEPSFVLLVRAEVVKQTPDKEPQRVPGSTKTPPSR
jgi:hypothetical protein